MVKKGIMSSLITYRNHYRSTLSSLYEQGEIDDFFKRGIAFFFDWNSLKIGLEPHYELSEDEKSQLDHLLAELKTGKPLQYIFGVTYFMELTLEVNKGVLIPRPETEELIEWVLNENTQNKLHLWDLCSGSGCIALAIQSAQKSWEVKGFELSEEALIIAKKNALKHHLSSNFYRADVLNWVTINESCDIIVSNPPYVFPSEKVQMHKNVLDHEPHLALFAPEDDPLCFYRAILKIAQENLHVKGKVYFEINPKCVEDLILLGKSYNFNNAVVKKDIFGKERFIKFSNV